MRYKKAQSETLVKVVFLAVVAIILIIAAVKIIGPERIFGSYLACRWEIFTQGIGLERVIGLGQIPTSCKADTTSINLNNLTINLKKTKSTIETFNLNNPDGQFENFDPTNDKSLVEFNLDREIAKKMKSCVDKVNHGAMPIFENWWHLYGEDKQSAMGRVFVYLKAPFGGNKKPAPKFCVICSVVRFDKDLTEPANGKYTIILKKEGGKDKVQSLAEWMKKNPVPAINKPYFEYIKLYEGTSDLFIEDKDYYYPINEPLAVVYERVNIHQLVSWGQTIGKTWQDTVGRYIGLRGEWKTEPLEPDHAIVLMPYKDLGKECDFMIG